MIELALGVGSASVGTIDLLKLFQFVLSHC